MILPREALWVKHRAALEACQVKRQITEKLAKNGYFSSKATVVCTLTGHGLKDPERAMDSSTEPICVQARMETVLEAMDLR